MINESNVSENKFSVYTNDITIGMSPYDVTISLKQNLPGEVIELGVVSMSPQHAKVLSQILKVHLDQYEELFGTIPTLDQEKMMKLEQQGVISVGR
ncbi:DUF3467 domain-containing protein [Clostridioides difficile]|nr:DUF3467 domain-containing protein [Clostridioides difficile]